MGALVPLPESDLLSHSEMLEILDSPQNHQSHRSNIEHYQYPPTYLLIARNHLRHDQYSYLASLCLLGMVANGSLHPLWSLFVINLTHGAFEGGKAFTLDG